jgi:1-deoxyxylulose-5-phosphate synthase
METRPLGRTGRSVSVVSLGTVELGLDYGLPDARGQRRPREADAVAIIETALAAGVTLIDTAPAYGDAERLVGRAIAGLASDRRPIVATKLLPLRAPDPSDRGVRDHVEASLEASRAALGVDCLDVVQIHNATRDDIRRGTLVEALARAREDGTIGYLGASIYAGDELGAVLGEERIEVAQVPLSALDRRLEGAPLTAAHRRGLGLLVRSALLRGVLTDRRLRLPGSLRPLAQAADQLERIAADAGLAGGLVELAYRYVLAQDGVSSVLVGASNAEEVEAAVGAAALGPLESSLIARIRSVAAPEPLLDPRTWPADA